MPIMLPNIDDRRYEDLRAETLARIPVHTPEWTNFNRSDPGVTLIELFAFLTETLLYRSNQIPERNRKKFLQLLRVPLNAAEPARGIVSFANASGPRETMTLAHGAEVLAGAVPFRTEQGLDVLPVEGQLFYKRELTDSPQNLKDYYNQLYASYRGQPPVEPLKLYETTPFPPPGGSVVDLIDETIDGSLWLALLARPVDVAADVARTLDDAREALANRTLSFGVVPSLQAERRVLSAHQSSTPSEELALRFFVPKVPPGGQLPVEAAQRKATYRELDAAASVEVLTEPGVIQVTLPGANQLGLWTNLDPLESGAGDFPPAIDDSRIAARVITWIRIRFPNRSLASLRWAGINAAMVTQRQSIVNERLPDGIGEPDQEAALSQRPVIGKSVRLRVQSSTASKADAWKRVEDLASLPPEVPRADPQAPAAPDDRPAADAKAFVVDGEAGRIRFGDGLHGARPQEGARIEVDYDVSSGLRGNVGAESIKSGPTLPPGVSVRNPVPTWGGADAEAVSAAEKLIPRYLQHRDRLVTVADYESIVTRTPGLDIARVEALAAYNPELPDIAPGDAPGAITVMIIPRTDPATPDAPMPDSLFLNTVCKYVEPRRLVTTEVHLRGPKYQDIWLSVGITVKAGESIAEVRERVKQRLRLFLSPLPSRFLSPSGEGEANDGWPLGTPVVPLELQAEASREPAVQRINGIRLGDADGIERTDIKMEGLELPRLRGISVTVGDPLHLAELIGTVPSEVVTGFVPVPIVPGEC